MKNSAQYNGSMLRQIHREHESMRRDLHNLKYSLYDLCRHTNGNESDVCNRIKAYVYDNTSDAYYNFLSFTNYKNTIEKTPEPSASLLVNVDSSPVNYVRSPPETRTATNVSLEPLYRQK